jgi:tetratricopeptide (TPR) repeat protein
VDTKPEVKNAHEVMDSDPTKALAMIDRILAESPEDPQAHYVRGQILLKLQRPKDALAPLERAYTAVVENGFFVPGAHRLFAYALAELGQYQRAIEVLDGCLAVYPDEINAWIDRANAKQELDDLTGALADLGEALTRSPDDKIALYNQACYLSLAGKHDAALDTLERLFVLEPSDRAVARDDDDLAALRDNPRFDKLTR